MTIKSTIIAVVFLALSGSTSATQSVTTYQTNAYQVVASWSTGTAPNRIYSYVTAWAGTETTGTGLRTPLAGASAALGVEQLDGSIVWTEGCYPSGTDALTTGFEFPDGAFSLDRNLRSAHLSLTFDCFVPTYPLNVPTGTSLDVVLDWSAPPPNRAQTGGKGSAPGNFTVVENLEATAVGSVTDGVHEYAPGPSDFANLLHLLGNFVVQ